MATWDFLCVGGPMDGKIITRTAGDYSPAAITYSAKAVELLPGGPLYRILAAPGVRPRDCEETILRAKFEPFSGGAGDGQL